MKVAFVTWKFPALANTFILNEIVEVLKRGFEVAVYSIDRSEESVVHDDIGRYALLERTWFLEDFVPEASKHSQEFAEYSADWLRERVNGFRGLAEHMRRTGVDVVHGCFANNCSTVAMVTSRLAGLPFTFECHAYDLFVDMRFPDEKIAQIPIRTGGHPRIEGNLGRDGEHGVSVGLDRTEVVARLHSATIASRRTLGA